MSEGTQSLSPEALEALMANHRRFLDFLSRRVESREVAEEILQGAYLKSVERGGTLREEESAVSWFYRLLRNAIIDHYRSQGVRARALERLVQELEEEGAPDEEVERAVCTCMGELIPTLKPAYAVLLQKVELGGKSVREVAEEEGISPNNAAVRLHRARQALKRRLEQFCGTCAEHACLDCTCSSSPKR